MDAKTDLYWLLGLLGLLLILWYATGGPSQIPSASGLFFKNPAEKYGQQITQPIIKNRQSEEEKKTDEEKIDKDARVDIFAGFNARMLVPDEEYLELNSYSRNAQSINISGWKLKSKNGRETTIPSGTSLPILGQISPEENIILEPGDKAFIITGASPLGKSFRLNKCIGYLGQMQDFHPRLPSNCPNPIKDEIIPPYLDQSCLSYLDKNFKICSLPISLPAELSSQCKNYVREVASYNQCVNRHKHDSDFYKPEWRIYLNQPYQLWNDNNETVYLYNKNSVLIDSYSY